MRSLTFLGDSLILKRLQRRVASASPLGVVLTFGLMIGGVFVGLMMPFSHHGSLAPIDALFLAVSAVTTTGLTPVKIHTALTFWGQLVLLVGIQIGGIATVLGLLALIRTVNSPWIRVQWLSNLSSEFWRVFRRVIGFVFLFETIGAIGLFLRWVPHHSVEQAVYLAIFHSVSAFCTSGFTLFDSNFVAFQSDFVTLGIVGTLAFLGGIGFWIWVDLDRVLDDRVTRARRRMSTVTRITLATLLPLFVVGTGVFYWVERAQPSFVIRAGLAVFHFVAASMGTGFTALPLATFSSGILVGMVLLFGIGAGLGGTGGGIRLPTMGVLGAVLTQRHMKGGLKLHNRRVTWETVGSAVFRVLVFAILIGGGALVLGALEAMPAKSLLFESASAVCNAGYSLGVTAHLSIWGKWAVMALMAGGRLSFWIVFVLKSRPLVPETVGLPDEEIYLG